MSASSLRSRVARLSASLLIAALLVCSTPAIALGTERVGGTDISGDAARAALAPAVTAPEGILRTSDGQTLWERDADAERAMASTTKIMTALVVLENAGMDEKVTISHGAASVGESAAGFVAGQVVTVHDLLEAMLVHSANDAAFALAEHVGGDVRSFVIMMNEKAAELGLKHTQFANPHGLDTQHHYTSAADLATMASVAMSDPRFREIVAMRDVRVKHGTQTLAFESSNQLLKTYAGATGVKTGWTDKAGYCLVASAERNGVSLVAVVLGTRSENDRFKQASALLDWGFAHYTISKYASADETAALVPVSDYLNRTVSAVVAGDITAPVFDVDGPVTRRIEMVREVAAPVKAGDRLGTLSIVQGDRLLAQVPVVAAADVAKPGFWLATKTMFTRVWRGIFGGRTEAAAVSLI